MKLRPTDALMILRQAVPWSRLAAVMVLTATATTVQAGVTVNLSTAPGSPVEGSTATGYTAAFYTNDAINALSSYPVGLGTAPSPTIGGLPASAGLEPGAVLQTFQTVVVGPNGVFPVGTNWLANSNESSWIGPGQNGNAGTSGLPFSAASAANGYNSTTSSPQGYYYYNTTFNLDSADAFLSGGLWATDNNGISIYLNGVLKANVTGAEAFASFTSFTIGSGFLNGVNNLTFVVFNENFGPNHNSPTGINIRGTVTTVPEPSTMIGAGLGCLVIGLGAYRRQRRAA